MKRRVAPKALEAMKERVREITSRNGGRSMRKVAEELRSYLLGWKAYFQLSDTPGVFGQLDEWIRHRMRALQLKHWKRGTTAFRELISLGASRELAARIAANTRRWWKNASMGLNIVMPTSYFDRLGVPRLAG